jgi:hypothetical protein
MLRPNESKTIVLVLLICGVLGLISTTPAPVWAQVTGATVLGSVRDTSGAMIPNAQISVRNVATGVTTRLTADLAGFYTAPNLLPGSYEMTASAPGFSTETQTKIPLTIGEQQLLNFTLKVGKVSQNIEVTGQAPVVDLTSSSIGGVVNSTTVVGLPLNGRDWTQLATLVPGVDTLPEQPAATGASSRANRGIGNQLSISGTRPQQNNYRLDGISIEDYAGGGPGSVAGVAMGTDAIAEFSVLTSNYSAEYGRTSGGVVNATTRSGTNQIHGSAYWFLRDEDFDAKNFFDQTRAPFHRNQFGGSVGGPIQKGKTFFFGNYEGLRQDLGVTNVNKVPSPDARKGIIHNADGTTTLLTINPLVLPFLAFYPLPNAGLLGIGNTGLALISTSTATSENFETARVDHKFSERDSTFGSWFLDQASISTPDSLDTWISGDTSLRQMGALEETHVFNPSLVNSLRVGYSRVVSNANTVIRAINPVAADPSLSSFAGRYAPQLSVTSLTTNSGGLGGLVSLDDTWNSYQIYDDAFLTKGLHSLKFGLAFEAMQLKRTADTGANGEFTFGSLSNFLTNQPKAFKGQLPDSISTPQLRQKLSGGYLQDDWRFLPSLTLNLGLRYEPVTVPTEIHNHLANLPTLTSPTLKLGSPLYNNPTWRNFEPRIGFAWDPFHNGKSAVRGAFGVFDVLPLPYEFFFAQAATAPYSKVLTEGNLPAGSFPKEAANPTTISQSTLIVPYVPQNPHRNYVLIWNLTLEQQLTPGTTMTLSYVGNHGVHMTYRADDANTVLPTSTTATGGLLWPFPAGSGQKLNPNWGAMRTMFWSGDSLYDALQLEVSKRMSHGFQVQGSYTWGKGIDTDSSSAVGDQFLNSISSPFLFCKTCNRGLTDFNIAQTLTAYYIWDVPTPRNWGVIGSQTLGGWEVGGIITAETGVPITPLIGGDPLGLNSSDPYDYPDRLTGSGCHTSVNPGNVSDYIKLNCFTLPQATPDIAAQCTPFSAAPGTCENLRGNVARNAVIGPGLVTWDASLFKNNYIPRISKTFNAQLRIEAFNVLNRANFATPVDNSTLFDQTGAQVAGAGALDQTSTPQREMQFALKLIW